MHCGIVYTNGPKRENRWTLANLMGHALEDARSVGVIGRQWLNRILACAHFTRADLGSFRDFRILKTEFDSLRGSFSTITRPYRCSFYDKNRNTHQLEIHLRDTMAFAPNGSTLASLGDLHQLPKIELPRNAIGAMDTLLKEDPKLYEDYAIRDAEIAALHMSRMVEFCQREGLGTEPPLTIGSIATNYVQLLWRELNINSLDVLGKEVVNTQRWSGRRKISRRQGVLKANVAESLPIATEAYHGGRNEAYMFGLTHDDFWTDLDLAGAYSTAMAAIKLPDWENLYSTKTYQVHLR